MKKESSTLTFISYAREDQEQALQVQRFLENNGQETWLDDSDMPIGAVWRKRVRQVINKSDYFVALLSEISVQKRRGFVWKEFNMALNKHRRTKQPVIIPIRLDQVEVPEEFERFTYMDLSEKTLDKTLLLIENGLPEETIEQPGWLPKRRLIALSLAAIMLISLLVIINWPKRSKLRFKATVFDSATNQHITGAYAYILGHKGDTICRSNFSGDDGQVNFDLDTTGEIKTTIWYTHPGYKTVSKSITLMAHDTYRSVRLAKISRSQDSSR